MAMAVVVVVLLLLPLMMRMMVVGMGDAIHTCPATSAARCLALFMARAKSTSVEKWFNGFELQIYYSSLVRSKYARAQRVTLTW